MKKSENLNKNISNNENKMGILGNGRGFLGLRVEQQRNLQDALGFGMIVLGLYFLLAYFDIIPFSPRFENILSTPSQLLFASILLIVVGGLINEKIRDFF